MTGKERAALRAQANGLDAIFQIGKEGVTDALKDGVDSALKKRELIKLSVLETSGMTAREAADELSRATGSDVIQVIGRRFVLYRKKEED
ncbi:MAG: YhbY family RNA-binding protein [Clostridiales bacterium]|nr:YhbY family RNA-binding protein [Clostridiales bacterium]